MAVSVMQRWLAVLWGRWTIGLTVAGAEAQPAVRVTMRLAEAGWHVVRQEILPRFEAVGNCRVGYRRTTRNAGVSPAGDTPGRAHGY